MLRVHPAREFGGVITLRPDRSCELASMIVSRTKLRDRVGEIVPGLPPQLASSEIIDVHAVDAGEQPLSTLCVYRIRFRHASANDLRHRMSNVG